MQGKRPLRPRSAPGAQGLKPIGLASKGSAFCAFSACVLQALGNEGQSRNRPTLVAVESTPGARSTVFRQFPPFAPARKESLQIAVERDEVLDLDIPQRDPSIRLAGTGMSGKGAASNLLLLILWELWYIPHYYYYYYYYIINRSIPGSRELFLHPPRRRRPSQGRATRPRPARCWSSRRSSGLSTSRCPRP